MNVKSLAESLERRYFVEECETSCDVMVGNRIFRTYDSKEEAEGVIDDLQKLYPDKEVKVVCKEECNESVDLNERVNHENDKINAVIRKAAKGNKLSDKEKKMLSDNNLRVSGSSVSGSSVTGPNGRSVHHYNRTDMRGPSNPSYKHSGVSQSGAHYLERAKKLRNAPPISDTDIDDKLSWYSRRSNDVPTRDEIRQELERDRQHDIRRYQEYGENAYQGRRNRNRQYNDQGSENGFGSPCNGWDLSRYQTYGGMKPNDRKAYDSYEKVDYLNYLTKDVNNPIKRNAKELGNNEASNELKDIRDDRNNAKRNLDYHKNIHGIKDEQGLSDEEEHIRKRMMKQMRDEIDRLHKDNERNKEYVRDSQEKFDTQEKRYNDFLQSKGIKRRER